MKKQRIKEILEAVFQALKSVKATNEEVTQLFGKNLFWSMHLGRYDQVSLQPSKSLTQILAELDWKEILREAIQLRGSSWADRPVVEYRNAGDTIYCALLMELRKRGYVR